MRSIELEDNSAFVKLSPADKQKVIDFISGFIQIRQEDLADNTIEPELEDDGTVSIYTGEVTEYIEDTFICYNCSAPNCQWHSGDDSTYEGEDDAEMLDHVMQHLGLIGGNET